MRKEGFSEQKRGGDKMPNDWKQLLIYIIVIIVIVFAVIKIWPVVIGGPLI